MNPQIEMTLPSAANAVILETQDLTRRFGKLTAVDQLNLSVQAGEVFGLLGPNGAGKSTVIKMLTTLLPPTSGRAYVGECEITRQPAQVRQLIGYVPQMLSADGSLTGSENLMIFAKLYNLPRRLRQQRVQEVLRLMGLQEAGDRLVRTYSGGMVRRLEVAQSVLHYPPLLFLDEPTVGLDPLARMTVWELVQQLRQIYGVTVFLTTHFMEEADHLCDRIAIMHQGRVVITGSPSELKSSLHQPDATLDDVFIHYTGDLLETGGNYRDISRVRRTVRRLG